MPRQGKVKGHVQIGGNESCTWWWYNELIFQEDVLIFSNDVPSILQCKMRCDNSINACLDKEKWNIISKLLKMHHFSLLKEAGPSHSSLP